MPRARSAAVEPARSRRRGVDATGRLTPCPSPRDGASAARRPASAGGRARGQSTRALLRAYHEGGDLRARERLIQQYMPLVKNLARRHSMRGEQYEDLVQVGCIGLIKAVDRFDLDRPGEFGGFAIPCVAGEIKRHLRDRGWPIRVPRRLQELRPGLCACSAELSAQLARPATISEIAQRSGVAAPDVAAALATEKIQAPVPLSAVPGEDGDEYGGWEGVLDGGYERGEQRALLAAGFRVLDGRERQLLHLRFFAGLSQPQIAREVGISQIHVSRLTRRALVKLRAEISTGQDATPAVAANGL
jgi:RNA polymerase sigma-B factor